MAKKTHGLGRGLDSLFAETEEWSTSVQEIALGELDPNPDQPRRTFRDDGITQLADSIREQGVLQPLLVVPTRNGRYRIVAGERRYRAGRMAGLETLPCIVKELDAIQQMEIALIENLQREDLNPMEAARGIDALMKQCGYTQEKVSARLGKSRPAVANMLRLLSLPAEVTDLVSEELLSSGHARALAGLDSREDQIRLARKAVADGLNVRQVEALVAQIRNGGTKKARPKTRALPPELGELQDKIRERIGLKSVLSGNVSRGKIVLSYSSRDELEHLNELLDRLNG